MNKITLFITLFIFISCSKPDNFKNPNGSLINVDSLGLYWKYHIFGEQGRHIIFEFYDKTFHLNEFELVFETTIENNSIDIRLVDKINIGECHNFPGSDSICSSSGGFYILADDIPIGSYEFYLISKYFVVRSEFIVKENWYELRIPENKHFTCYKTEDYIRPRDIISGSIVFRDSLNIIYAEELKEEYKSIGLADTSLPECPYCTSLDEEGFPINTFWPPDNYSFGLLYKNNGVSFRDVVDITQNYYNSTELNIYLYSGMGDQARFSQQEGVYIYYANK